MDVGSKNGGSRRRSVRSDLKGVKNRFQLPCPRSCSAGASTVEAHALRYMLSTFLLWLISKRDMHGYELIKEIRKDVCINPIPPSRLYPALRDLLKRGLVSQRSEPHGKRVRKVYAITNKGTAALKHARKHLRESSLRREFLLEMLK